MFNGKMKKIGNIVTNVLLCIFLVISVFAVFVTVLSKKDADGAAEIFGYQMRIVISDSMESCEYTDVSAYDIKDIPVRSMLFVKVMPTDRKAADEWYSNLKVGDVLTFRYVYASQVTITHRITSIEEKPTGGYIIKLAGDNKNSEVAIKGQLEQEIDTSVPNNMNYVIGKVEGQSYLFGVIMSIIMQPLGIVFIIIIPCFAIIISEVIKITKVVGADKRKKEQEEMAAKEKELEELRRRLDELEKAKNNKGDET